MSANKMVRIFDYAQFAEPLRDEIKATITGVAEANGLEIEYVSKKTGRKEDRIQTLLAKRGQQPGVVHLFSAMEGCQTYKPWYDKASGKSYLKAAESKCQHYYIYFIDEDLGLCYLRIPT